MSDLAILFRRHRLVVEKIISGELDELSQEAYEDFYDYYLTLGEIPYGTVKARDGDPYIWVNARVRRDANFERLI